MHWHELTDVVHHACAVHVWSFILSWIDADKLINKCLCDAFVISGLAKRQLLSTSSSVQRLCIWDTSSVSAILKLRKTSSFFGPVRVLNFSFFYSLQPKRYSQMFPSLSVWSSVVWAPCWGSLIDHWKVKLCTRCSTLSMPEKRARNFQSPPPPKEYSTSNVLSPIAREVSQLLSLCHTDPSQARYKRRES